MQVQQNPGPLRTEITTKEFSSKYESKREVYHFVAVDCGFYVPEYDCVTIYFLKDIMTGEKKCKFNMCRRHPYWRAADPSLNLFSHQEQGRPTRERTAIRGPHHREDRQVH